MINIININRDKLIGQHYDSLHAILKEYDHGYDEQVTISMIIDNDRIMGTCIFRTGLVYELLVRPEYRLKGAGRSLLNNAVNKTNGSIKVAVREYNWDGARFLSHIGCEYLNIRYMHDSRYMIFNYDPQSITKQHADTKVDVILDKFMCETPIFMTIGDSIK